MGILKLLPGLVMGLAIAYGTACIALRYGQNRFIFVPSPEMDVTPADLGLLYQDVWLPITTSTGKVERLHGWWIPAPRPQQAGVLLYLHGNGLNISANVEQSKRLQQLGLSVFLPDYRGYGRSEGSFPTEATVYQDASTVWSYLTQERKIKPGNLIIYGHSLGGAIAINLAQQHPDAAGLIVQSSFTSMAAMVERAGWTKFFPVKLLLTQQFDSLARVKSLVMPVFYIHGTADTLIPYQMSEALYAATPGTKHLMLIEGGGHNNLAEVGGDRYLNALQKFISQSLLAQNQPTPKR